MSKPTRDRWTSDRVEQAVTALHGHGDIQAASFGVVNGYLDYRDVPFPQASETPVAQSETTTFTEITGYTDFQAVHWDGLDLSGASMRSTRFTDSTISRSRFVGADLTDLRIWGTTFDRTVFDRANLTDASLGAWQDGRGSRFESCTFLRSKVKDLMSDAGEFRDCTFDVTMRDVQFMSTVFDTCTFRGTYTQVLFDGRDLHDSTGRPGRNTMSGCDFTQAALSDTAFTAIDARNLRLPTNEDTVVVEHYPANLPKALAWVDSASGDDLPDVGRDILRDMLVYSEPQLLPPDASVWFNLADFREPSLPQLELAARAALAAASD